MKLIIFMLLFISLVGLVQADPNVPRSGLYKRVELSASTMETSTGSVEYLDNKDGTVTVTHIGNGKKFSRKYPQKEISNQCIKYDKDFKLPDNMNCTHDRPIPNGNTSTVVSECQGIKTKIVYTKKSSDVYEYTVTTEMKTGPQGFVHTGMPDRSMMENMINAQPPEKRAEMRKQMAQLYSPEMEAMRKKQLAEAAQGRELAIRDLKNEIAAEKDPAARAQLQSALGQLEGTKTPGRTYMKSGTKYALIRIGDC